MNRLAAGVVALLWSFPSLGSALDDAIALVLKSHPVLAAQEASVAETARQRSWSSAATLGWTERGTEYGGTAGPNAGVSLRIPLFDRTPELKLAQSQAEAARNRDAVLTAFLADVRMLRDLAGKVTEADDLRRLHQDRAAYWKQAVKEGRAEQDKLWPEAESWKRAEHAYRQLRANLDMALDTTARRFGGEEWLRLRDLLAAITS